MLPVARCSFVVPKPKAECSKSEQLTVSFAAGYIAGVFCAVVSHPADNLVSKMNQNAKATAGEVRGPLIPEPLRAGHPPHAQVMWVLGETRSSPWCVCVRRRSSRKWASSASSPAACLCVS